MAEKYLELGLGVELGSEGQQTKFPQMYTTKGSVTSGNLTN